MHFWQGQSHSGLKLRLSEGSRRENSGMFLKFQGVEGSKEVPHEFWYCDVSFAAKLRNEKCKKPRGLAD